MCKWIFNFLHSQAAIRFNAYSLLKVPRKKYTLCFGKQGGEKQWLLFMASLPYHTIELKQIVCDCTKCTNLMRPHRADNQHIIFDVCVHSWFVWPTVSLASIFKVTKNCSSSCPIAASSRSVGIFLHCWWFAAAVEGRNTTRKTIHFLCSECKLQLKRPLNSQPLCCCKLAQIHWSQLARFPRQFKSVLLHWSWWSNINL